ncbi:MAG: hypothetical protein WKF30_17675, partial [Pyrinomonadaceae bacterium]
MKIVTFSIDDKDPRVGALLAGELVLDFAAALGKDQNPLAWLDLDGKLFNDARAMYERVTKDGATLNQLREGEAIVDRARVKLLAPVARPGKIICVGLNYRDHAAES